MVFWNKKKRKSSSGNGPSTSKPTGKRKYQPLEVKVMAMEAKEAGLTSKEVAEVVGVNPVTIDKWCREWRDKGAEAFAYHFYSPAVRGISTTLKKRIEEFRTDNPTAGVQRISDELRRNEALSVSPETVRKVVNEAGLGNPAPQSKRRPPQIRRFEREIPNAMWQTDIFMFELKRMYKVYLVGIIDDHSRYMVGHGLFRQQTAEAVLEVLQGAIGQWGAPREILSDNGRQFVAWRGKSRFQKVLTRQGVQHVRSAPHHPMTLGKIERFWKTIWTEFLEESAFASFADARQRLDNWVHYYNHQRSHQGIGGAAPADRFYGVAGDVEEAIKQGCKENALQLALGQETRPPLYLLGKLGSTDVRVTRKGEDIELKIGDSVHETIRMGAAFSIDREGHFTREGYDDSLAEHDERGEVPGGEDGAERGDADQGDLRGVWSDAPDLEQGDREGGGSGPDSPGVEAPWEEAEVRGSPEDYRAFEEACLLGEGSGPLENEV